MSEYDDVVERQRLLLEAEAWAKNIKSIHVHSLTSMYYETEFKLWDEIDIDSVKWERRPVGKHYI